MSDLPNDAYWVTQGSVMAGPYPGERRKEDAVNTLTALTDAGVTHFIDLTFPKGESTDSLEPYECLLDRLPNGNLPGYSRFSIVDQYIPTQEFMGEILDEIGSLLGRGEVVYVHCWGGVGRTGTVVACHLIDAGMTANQALDFLQSDRRDLIRGHRPSPEMPEQEAFVRAWVDRQAP